MRGNTVVKLSSKVIVGTVPKSSMLTEFVDPINKGWSKRFSFFSRFFSANFRRQYLGNGLSYLFQN